MTEKSATVNYRLVPVELPPLPPGEEVPFPDKINIPDSLSLDVTNDGIRDRISITIVDGGVSIYYEEGYEAFFTEDISVKVRLFREKKKFFPLKPEKKIPWVHSIEKFVVEGADIAFTVVGVKKGSDGGDLAFRGAYLLEPESPPEEKTPLPTPPPPPI